jgi:DNA repair exonuclease SbcCD ATPase subunit
MTELQSYQQKVPVAVKTPEKLGAEIRNLTYAAKQLTLFYAVEIGRRLVEAKELVAHGEWLNWLETETEFSQPTANRFMRVYNEYAADQGSLFGAETKYSTLNNLSISNALRLLAVPEEEREEFAREVDAEHLSSRELEAAIRERDEAKRALEAEIARRAEVVAPYEEKVRELERAVGDAGPYRERAEAAEAKLREAEAQAEEDADTIADLEKQIETLEARPVDVAVQEPDPDEIERRAAELANKAIEAAAADEEKRRAEAVAPYEEKVRELERAAEGVGPYKEQAEAAEAKIKALEEKAKAERDKLREKLKAAEEKAAEAEKRRAEGVAPYKAEAEQARAEVDALKKQLAMSGGEMVVFKLRFEAWQMAYQAMREALDCLAEEQREKCEAAVKAVIAGWTA